MIDFAATDFAPSLDDLAPCSASASREERKTRRRKVEALRHRERTASYGTDPEDGSWGLRGRWDPEAGAVLEKAIEAALGEGLGKVMEGDETSSTSPVPVVSRAEGYQVVVHVSAETPGPDVSA